MASKLLASGSASGLQMARCMMVRIVGLLAVVLLAGCGVGADESYADLGAGSSGQGLEQASPTGLPVPDTQPPETTTPVPGKDPGTVALPQDPIPVYLGKPTPQPNGGRTTDPGVEGVPPPGLPPPLPGLPPLPRGP